MIKFEDFLTTNPGMEKDDHIAYMRAKRRKSQDYGNNAESRSAWSKSLETIARKRQLAKISPKDKETLVKIMALLDKEKKKK